LGASKRASTSLVLPTMGTMMRTGFVGAHSGVCAWTAKLMAPSTTVAEAQRRKLVWINLKSGNPFMADFLVLSK
jgi:hypothetical protein